jgi:hypothetical protein
MSATKPKPLLKAKSSFIKGFSFNRDLIVQSSSTLPTGLKIQRVKKKVKPPLPSFFEQPD